MRVPTGAAAGTVALPRTAGRTNGGAFGSSVCSTWSTAKPTARMESSVGRLQSQHTTSRFSQLSRSLAPARWARTLPSRRYASMREPRPHRPARPAGEAAAEMQAEVRAGRLDRAAVDAVLEAAGHRVPRRREGLAGPAALTAREVEVLVLLARGLPNRQIAERLVITPKTAGNHVEHIYAKIDASSRAAAAMFAVQHGLLPEETLAAPAHP
jgi:DNA-binding CsgD family transcriptional regulator